jgi:hypothetical protein
VQLFGQVFAVTLASIGVIWVGWIALWWIEQRW